MRDRCTRSLRGRYAAVAGGAPHSVSSTALQSSPRLLTAQRGEAAPGQHIVAAAAIVGDQLFLPFDCTPVPHTPTISACGASGIDSTFSSTIETCQCDGVSAASVARPSGGLIARLRGRIFLPAA